MGAALLLLLLLLLPVSLALPCPDGTTFDAATNKCIHVGHNLVSWQAADANCKSFGQKLVQIESGFDNSAIMEIASALAKGCTSFWLGGQCASSSASTCKWGDGTPFTYQRFAPDEPNVAKGNCVTASTQFNGVWSTESCSAAQHCSLCESPATPDPDLKRDCVDWLHAGATKSGLFNIAGPTGQPVTVYCDMHEAGGGWTAIQRRSDARVVFWSRTWDEYKNGFGAPIDPSYYVGNELIYHLTNSYGTNNTLRIELVGDQWTQSATPNGYWWQHYDMFRLDSEDSKYTLHVSHDWQHVVGNASANDMTYSDGQPFSTVDRINSRNADCVTKNHMGGWWLGNCAMCSLNGEYTPSVMHDEYGLFWILNGETVINPKHTRMFIRNNRPANT